MHPNKALFLDRDGVINIEKCYLHRREEFEFQEGIFELCRAAQSLGYLLVVVTNQAGIARGMYTEADFQELTDWMIGKFGEQQIGISRVYYCPFHPVHGVGEYMRDSPDRKPKPGMILQAQRDLQLDLRSSVLIGDQMSDIAAGEAAGVGTNILLRSSSETYTNEEPQNVADSLQEIRRQFFLSAGHELSPFQQLADRL